MFATVMARVIVHVLGTSYAESMCEWVTHLTDIKALVDTLQVPELVLRKLRHHLALQRPHGRDIHELPGLVLSVDSLELALLSPGYSEGELADHGENLLSIVGGVVLQSRGPRVGQGSIGLQQP